MNQTVSNIAVLGSTGSIGSSTMDVARRLSDRINIVGLSAYRQIDLLHRQAAEFKPEWVVGCESAYFDQFNAKNDVASWECDTLTGLESLEKLVQASELDTIVAAIVGSAGLASTIAAVESGKRVALANKETLVMAGQLVMSKANESGSEIIPVDSEHSAVFQAIRGGNSDELSRIVLTASGGPFRDYSKKQLESVTVSDALKHPTWSMGRKISVDSATMMNKALEIVEARWLFGVPSEKIAVVVHPQSIVHSMIEYVDGSVISQSSPPDMRLPIQYALTFPERVSGPAKRMDWTQESVHEFFPPDLDRFPALGLGFEVAERGGTTGAVVNAANEAAVEAFLENKIRFVDIVPACRNLLENHHFEPHPTLDTLVRVDQWARQEIDKWICA